MKFQISEGVLAILQFAAWMATAGSALMLLVANLSNKRSDPFDPTWIAIGAGCAAFAIAATLGRVQIHTLNELGDIKFLLREQSEKK